MRLLFRFHFDQCVPAEFFKYVALVKAFAVFHKKSPTLLQVGLYPYSDDE